MSDTGGSARYPTDVVRSSSRPAPEPPPEPVTAGGQGSETVLPTDDVLARLRAKVAARKAAGEYPADLPERMAAHFDDLLGGRGSSSVNLDQLGTALAAAREARKFALERVPLASQKPGGAAVHRVIGKVTARQTQGVLEQVQASADATSAALDALGHAVAQLRNDLLVEAKGLDEQAAQARLAVGRVEQGLARLEQTVRDHSATTSALAVDVQRQAEALAALAPRVDSMAAQTHIDDARIDARIARLEKAEEARGFRPWYDTGAFEARFRGTRDELLAHYHDLGRFFLDADGVPLGIVLDIGCGRGEMLELLLAWGIDGYGVEIDAGLVDDVRARGLRATLDDGLGHLAAVADESLGGIVLLQVIEHLHPQQQLDLVALAFRKLRPGGRFVVETVNAQSLYVYANSMYLDPTHTRPVHPHYLQFLCNEIGFAEVLLDYRSPVPSSAELPAVQSSAAADEGFRRLSALLHGHQDYAVIATK